MSKAVIRVAVVGHTNTGKTSLLRTLTRDNSFGAIADQASTTRHVEGARLMVRGRPVLEFYDTPGLEDSISLLEALEQIQHNSQQEWLEVIQEFVNSTQAHDTFAQEAKSLRQVIASALVLYVIDVREQVLGKYRDELDILIRTARPLILLFNFIDSSDAKTEQWQDYLSRVGLHATLSFNPLIIDAVAERKLFEKMRALRDELYQPLGEVIAELTRQRQRLRRVGLDIIIDFLLDSAACTVMCSKAVDFAAQQRALAEALEQREWRCAQELLRLHGFRSEDFKPEQILPDQTETAGIPLSLNAIKHLGLRSGGGAAKGAAAGLGFDVMLAGLSLGVGTAVGAGLGAAYTIRNQGVRLINKARGISELRISDNSLVLLAARQLALAQILLNRGHADPRPVKLSVEAIEHLQTILTDHLPEILATARLYPNWSALGRQFNGNSKRLEASKQQKELKAQLTEQLNTALDQIT